MKTFSTARRIGCVMGAIAALAFGHAAAQSQPAAATKLIVGFAAGGSNDIVARVVAKKAGELLGTNIVVVNQPGANGAIAAEAVARAKPDGKTLLIASPSVLAIAPVLNAALPYNPTKDFVGIGTVAVNAQVIAINPKVSATTLTEFLASSATTPATIASAGSGGLSHLTIEMLRFVSNANPTHVPFKGGALATNDVVAGHVDGIVMDLPPLKAFIESGKLRALAVTGRTRSSFLPAVPTAMEAGVRDMEAVNWFSVMAPKGTPKATADALHAAFTKAATDPAVVESLSKSGIEPMTQNSREDFDAFLQAELKRWKTVVDSAKIVIKD